MTCDKKETVFTTASQLILHYHNNFCYFRASFADNVKKPNQQKNHKNPTTF